MLVAGFAPRTASRRRAVGRRAGRLVLALVALSLGLAACAPRPGEGPPGPPEQLARGEALYQANCQGCHGGPIGGIMMDIPPPHNANGHTWHHPDCQLVEIVLDGSGEMGRMMREMMGGKDAPRMPAFRGRLSAEEVEAVLAYIKTWWTPEQREHQARATRSFCVEQRR